MTAWLRKNCSSCGTVPYANKIGCAFSSLKKDVLCEVCLMTQIEPRMEVDCEKSQTCSRKVKLDKAQVEANTVSCNIC